MTLFILAEVAVVYFIITVFLFFRGRLYHVLVAILKEMRWEKLRRQQERQQEIAELRAKNKKLTTEFEVVKRTAESAGKTIPEQLRDRVEQLSEDARQDGTDPDEPPGADPAEQLNWMRRRILELEQQLLSGDIDEEMWQEKAGDTLRELGVEPGSSSRKELAGEELRNEQLENDLKQYRNQYEAAKDRISFLEKELEDFKSIDISNDRMMEKPEPGQYADELYQLRCDKFDMQESLNQLRLKLQQMNPNSPEFEQAQKQQMQNMERYIKDADVTMNLMEKEMEAAQQAKNELDEEVRELRAKMASLKEKSEDGNPLNKENVEQLSANTNKQAESVSNLRDSLDQLRSGGDREQVAEYQEAEIGRLELLVRDTQSCVSVLEMELEQAQLAIGNLSEREQDLLRQLAERPEADEIDGDHPPMPEHLKALSDEQKDVLVKLRKTANDVRQEDADISLLAQQQEEEIDQLQKLLRQMENAVQQLQEDAEAAESAAPEPQRPADERPDSSENVEEMESLLRQFMSDSQSMLRRLKSLEDENKRLKGGSKAADTTPTS
ncbi:hypothetical protein [Saccharospirillum sp. MSK14-1]|uniref:hypothetical protein n=1 Tax=Saccharospirillum sp. MSK14-1 TaxID=1897632 RepID=UPI0011B272E7|nr:hypothetical protein [Saccharospirillum sp. MSK14-1]